MAGRNISTKHEALGAVRVMRTGGCMGEVVGMAAAVCKKRETTPRGVYERHLAELQELMRRGAGKSPEAVPDYENQGEGKRQQGRRAAPTVPRLPFDVGPNRALAATVSAADGRPLENAQLLNDGKANISDNAARWLGRGQLPHEIEFAWKQPVTIAAARIISGYFDGTAVVGPIGEFTLQWHDGTQWNDIEGVSAAGNADPFWAQSFRPITTTRLRLRIAKTKDDVSRIWEIEFYAPRP